MEDDQRGRDPKWLSGWTEPDELDLRRDAIEIHCLVEDCTIWACQSDDYKLQSLLTKIATDERFRDVVTVSADEKVTVMRLQASMASRARLTAAASTEEVIRPYRCRVRGSGTRRRARL
jgi:hypothetical protein